MFQMARYGWKANQGEEDEILWKHRNKWNGKRQELRTSVSTCPFIIAFLKFIENFHTSGLKRKRNSCRRVTTRCP
jgi:hypothetical protein